MATVKISNNLRHQVMQSGSCDIATTIMIKKLTISAVFTKFQANDTRCRLTA